MIKIGIIGGSGLYQLFTETEEIQHETAYGNALLYQTKLNSKTVYFLPRHGKSHHLPPHRINYRSNLSALHHFGVECILSTAAVGSLVSSFVPGMFGTIGQFIDMTKKRADTFFDSFSEGIHHADMTQPYDNKLNSILISIIKDFELACKESLTMVVTEGPRFETSAEIKAYQSWGGEIVGMTGYPEVALSNELAIPFACIAVSTNFAAGISKTPLSHEEVVAQMQQSAEKLQCIIKRFIELV